MLDPPFFGRSCRDCGPVSLGKTGGGGVGGGRPQLSKDMAEMSCSTL